VIARIPSLAFGIAPDYFLGLRQRGQVGIGHRHSLCLSNYWSRRIIEEMRERGSCHALENETGLSWQRDV
jgi:hypothetical protein